MSKKLLAVVLLLALLTPLAALAQETDGDEVYALLSPQGERIAGYAGVPDVGDEYIAGKMVFNTFHAHQRENTALLVLGLDTNVIF